ncbi:MAG: NADP-dependent malic enzyme [Chloroflexi bacterium]|nr:NADP-dependent malic enzyme [Chloroflexota bacterium]
MGASNVIDRDAALEYHHLGGRPGKIQVVPTKPTLTQRDLSLAYTPGVAQAVLEIARDPSTAFDYTARGNLVAVITNGTAILGLGNRGPLAAKPVMEGKALLFKRFADIDVFDLEVDAHTVDEMVALVKALAPTFGGINLEDIAAPARFEIEERLRHDVDIPVFHDDQHGTAIISGAALINALTIVGKPIDQAKVVVSGAGAAGIASAELYLDLGVRREHLVLCDSRGVIYKGRPEGMNRWKERLASETPARTQLEAMRGADVFLGVSAADTVTPEMLDGMGERPILLLLSNPDPEIRYDLAVETRPDAIVATGRSDYPNQVNNSMGFPYIFRGALDVRAREINQPMKLAAAHAIAELAREDVPDIVLSAYGLESLRFGPHYIVPKQFDPRALSRIAPAVAQAAMETGVARIAVDLDEYRESLDARFGRGFQIMNRLMQRARTAPKRIVLPEGEEPKILRAAVQIQEQGIGLPILLGRPEVIAERAASLGLNLVPEAIDPARSNRLPAYAEELFRLRARKGMTLARAMGRMVRPNYFGLMMVQQGEADAFLSGLTYEYGAVIRPALEVVGTRLGVQRVCGVYILLAQEIPGSSLQLRPYFLTDATVNISPTAEDLAESAIQVAELAREFDVEPRIAMLSFSNFGSTRHPQSEKMRRAVEIVRERRPDLAVDGEMQADTAVVPELIEQRYPFSRVRDANVLVFPSLEAANVTYKLLQRLGGAEVIGPVLLGMGKAVHVLQAGDEVKNIVRMAAMAVLDAQLREASGQPGRSGVEEGAMAGT